MSTMGPGDVGDEKKSSSSGCVCFSFYFAISSYLSVFVPIISLPSVL